MKKRKFLGFTAAFLALCIIIMGGLLLLQEYQKNMPENPADCMIILGCAVRGDAPSPMLTRRMEKALEIYRAGLAPVIIASGGKGRNENISEAQAMQNYLTKNGIPEGNVLLEDESTNTWQNLVNAQKIMRDKGYESAIIVTSEFHLPRALSYAKELGLPAKGAGAMTWWHLRIYYTLREVASNIKHMLTKA